MKIEKVQILDFQGISGKKEFVPDKMNVFKGENGMGKTSMLNAVRYALTGKEPEGLLFNGDAESCAVGVTIDGISYVRQKFRDKRPARCIVNGKVTSAVSMNESIQAATGVPVGAIKVASSQDIIRSLSKKELSELLLSYIPENLSLEDLYGYIGTITDTQKELLAEQIKKEPFGVPAINEAHDKLFEKRRALKKDVASKRAVYESRKATVPASKGEREKLEAAIKALDERRGIALSFASAKADYEKALAAKKAKDLELADIEKELAALGPAKTDEEISGLLAKWTSLNEKKEGLQSLITRSKENIRLMEETIEKLKTPGCPLSDKLVCTADKSLLSKELSVSVEETKKSLAEAADGLAFVSEEAEVALAAHKAAMETETKRANLKSRFETISKIETPIPVAPKEGEDTGKIDEELARIRKRLADIDLANENVALFKELEEKERALANLDFLVKALDANGEVKGRLIFHYLSVFEDAVNEKAEKLRPGMRMRFSSKAGVDVSLDVRGTGQYLDYDSLSGGERVLYLYLMLDLFNQLSGARLLVLDELSVLDGKNIDALMELVKEDAENYDHVFVALTDNSEAKSI